MHERDALARYGVHVLTIYSRRLDIGGDPNRLGFIGNYEIKPAVEHGTFVPTGVGFDL